MRTSSAFLPSTLILLTFAACGGSVGKKVDGGGAAGSSEAGGGGSEAGAGGSEAGAGGSEAGAADADVADAAAGAGGSDDDGGPPRGLDGHLCPTSDAGAPPSGPDDVTFLPNVTVTTIAGSDVAGKVDGTAAQALFENPVSVVIEPTGSLLVCDFENDSLRRIEMPDATVAVSTLTSQANFQKPFGLTFGTDGTLFVDTDFNPSGLKNQTSGTIWKVDTTTGSATPFAVGIGRPRGLAPLSDGRLVLGDYQNSQVLLLDTTTGAVTLLAGDPGCAGMANGTGGAALFMVPYGVVALPDGTIVVADEGNHVLRAVTLAGDVTTYAGDGGDGAVDGARLAARFSQPTALVVDAAGEIFVTDPGAHRVRRVGVDGAVVTVAGDGTAGFMDGTGAMAKLNGVEGIAVKPDGKTLYIADGTRGVIGQPYNRVRKIVIGP